MKVILLHSAPRSGSTWLQTLFDSYPNVKTVYQPLFSYAFKNRVNDDSTTKEIDELCKDLLLTNDPFCLRETKYHTNNNETPMPVFSKGEYNTLLIKNVHHHYLMERFLQCGHKLLALVRDPRGVINSQLCASRETDPDWLYARTKNNNQRENYFGYIKWKQVLYMFDDLKDRYPEQVNIIRYEDLVINFEAEVQQISSFLGFDKNPMCEAQKIITSKDSSYDYSIYRTNIVIDKWKKNLDPKIIDYINNDIRNDQIIQKYYSPEK